MHVRFALPPEVMLKIEAVIGECETTHDGEICFAVEPAMDLGLLLKGISARERAIQVFSDMRVWDTQGNNGVLIYLLLADHDVEIVADRGIHEKVGPQGWESICKRMEECFRQRRFEEGVVLGIRAVSEELSRHFPNTGKKTNELPDKPVII